MEDKPTGITKVKGLPRSVRGRPRATGRAGPAMGHERAVKGARTLWPSRRAPIEAYGTREPRYKPLFDKTFMTKGSIEECVAWFKANRHDVEACRGTMQHMLRPPLVTLGTAVGKRNALHKAGPFGKGLGPLRPVAECRHILLLQMGVNVGVYREASQTSEGKGKEAASWYAGFEDREDVIKEIVRLGDIFKATATLRTFTIIALGRVLTDLTTKPARTHGKKELLVQAILSQLRSRIATRAKVMAETEVEAPGPATTNYPDNSHFWQAADDLAGQSPDEKAPPSFLTRIEAQLPLIRGNPRPMLPVQRELIPTELKEVHQTAVSNVASQLGDSVTPHLIPLLHNFCTFAVCQYLHIPKSQVIALARILISTGADLAALSDLQPLLHSTPVDELPLALRKLLGTDQALDGSRAAVYLAFCAEQGFAVSGYAGVCGLAMPRAAIQEREMGIVYEGRGTDVRTGGNWSGDGTLLGRELVRLKLGSRFQDAIRSNFTSAFPASVISNGVENTKFVRIPLISISSVPNVDSPNYLDPSVMEIFAHSLLNYPSKHPTRLRQLNAARCGVPIPHMISSDIQRPVIRHPELNGNSVLHILSAPPNYYSRPLPEGIDITIFDKYPGPQIQSLRALFSMSLHRGGHFDEVIPLIPVFIDASLKPGVYTWSAMTEDVISDFRGRLGIENLRRPFKVLVIGDLRAWLGLDEAKGKRQWDEAMPMIGDWGIYHVDGKAFWTIFGFQPNFTNRRPLPDLVETLLAINVLACLLQPYPISPASIDLFREKERLFLDTYTNLAYRAASQLHAIYTSARINTQASLVKSGRVRPDNQRYIDKLPFFTTISLSSNVLRLVTNRQDATVKFHTIPRSVYEKWTDEIPQDQKDASVRALWSVRAMIVPDIVVDRYVVRICEDMATIEFPDLGKPEWEEACRRTGFFAEFDDPSIMNAITLVGRGRSILRKMAVESKTGAQQPASIDSIPQRNVTVDPYFDFLMSNVIPPDTLLNLSIEHVYLPRGQDQEISDEWNDDDAFQTLMAVARPHLDLNPLNIRDVHLPRMTEEEPETVVGPEEFAGDWIDISDNESDSEFRSEPSESDEEDPEAQMEHDGADGIYSRENDEEDDLGWELEFAV